MSSCQGSRSNGSPALVPRVDFEWRRKPEKKSSTRWPAAWSYRQPSRTALTSCVSRIQAGSQPSLRAIARARDRSDGLPTSTATDERLQAIDGLLGGRLDA